MAVLETELARFARAKADFVADFSEVSTLARRNRNTPLPPTLLVVPRCPLALCCGHRASDCPDGGGRRRGCAGARVTRGCVAAGGLRVHRGGVGGQAGALRSGGAEVGPLHRAEGGLKQSLGGTADGRGRSPHSWGE